jgi:hypothetical protein
LNVAAYRVGRRGQTGIEIAIIFAILQLTIVITMIIPVAFLKIHLVRMLEIEYNYDNAELALLTLLSDKSIYRGLSIYVADPSGIPDSSYTGNGVEAAVKTRLSQLVASGCYKLSFSGRSISSGSCTTEYIASAYILLPGGSKLEKLILEIK